MKKQWKKPEGCIGCKNAKCIEGCPVAINIPEFIGHLKTGDVKEAFDVISAAVSTSCCMDV